jgi:hypothetical protein
VPDPRRRGAPAPAAPELDAAARELPHTAPEPLPPALPPHAPAEPSDPAFAPQTASTLHEALAFDASLAAAPAPDLNPAPSYEPLGGPWVELRTVSLPHPLLDSPGEAEAEAQAGGEEGDAVRAFPSCARASRVRSRLCTRPPGPMFGGQF